MRIIGGEWGGRKIHPPSKMPYTRPTTDIAKEGLFNIIQSNRDLEGMKTLDLFGGTGVISFELASRGAADLTIVEKDSQMLAFIRKTAETLGLSQLKVVPSDVFRFLKNTPRTIRFYFCRSPVCPGNHRSDSATGGAGEFVKRKWMVRSGTYTAQSL